MQPVTVTTQSIAKPSGLTPGDYHVWIEKDASIIRDYTGPSQNPPASFSQDISNGAIIIRAQRLATSGDGIGPVVSRDYTVTDGEMVEVPLAILVGGA